jgi:SPP1 gp7 family putative phage head morphogenesis protein
MIHMHHPHSRTVAIVRLLRAMGPLRRRRGRLPRQQQPDALRREYYNAIKRVAVEPVQRAFAMERGEILRLYADELRATGRMDESARDARAKSLVARARLRADDLVRTRDLHDIADQFGKRTDAFQRQQFGRQVQQALAVPLESIEKPTTDRIPAFAADNVSLIRAVPERYFDRIQEAMQDAFANGTSVDELADRLTEIDGIAESDALRIARDQIGKLNAQVNQDRQESLGVTGYIWRGAMDQRERDEHREREGQHFDWDDPPEDGHPGEPVQCRCYSEPDFSSILDSLN